MSIVHRFLFLDIDGVLSTVRHSEYLIDHGEEDHDAYGAVFDPEAIENLAYIIHQVPDVKIIISSNWRIKGREWMDRMWEERNMPGKIFSFTPALERIYFTDIEQHISSESQNAVGVTSLEIDEWLRLNVKSDDRYFYAILDDDTNYFPFQASNAVFCDVYNGITRNEAERVIEILHVGYEDEVKDNIINFDIMPHSNNSKPHLDAVIHEDGRTNLIGPEKSQK